MLANRLAAARKRAGLSQRQLAHEMGGRYDRTMISHVESGRSGFVHDGLSKAAEILGVSIDYLLGHTNDPTPSHILAKNSGVDEDRSLDVARVSMVAATVGAGQGQHGYDETILAKLPLPKTWLPDGGVNPDDYNIVSHTGDWMEPLLPHGSTILVNLASQEFKHKGVFLLQFEEQIMEDKVKNLTPMRLLWGPRLPNDDGERWFVKFDKEEINPGPYGWALNYFDIKRVIGEVVLVVTFP